MRRWGQTLWTGLLLGGLACLLFSFPAQSAESARKGIQICLDLIIPSLFPFFVVSSLAISTGLAGLLAQPLEKAIRFLFGVGSAGASLLFLGAVGGYPTGARTLAQMTALGDLSPREARQLYLFCNNFSCSAAVAVAVCVAADLKSAADSGELTL